MAYPANGATGTKPPGDAEAPLISPSTQSLVSPVVPASTVQVYVCDNNGIAQLVEVPVGTTLMKLVRAAFQEPTFTTGAFLDFEGKDLAQDQLVTAADATRWTADKPLKLKYKRDDSCVIL